MERHRQLVRDGYLREIHEKMIKHDISFEEITDFVENRYIDHKVRMRNIRNEKIMRRKNLENLEKARQAKASKRVGK